MFYWMLLVLSMSMSQAMAADADKINLTKAGTAVCAAEQEREWNEAATYLQDIKGLDPQYQKIGLNPAIKFGPVLGMNWYPADRNKQTVCGKLRDFDFYDGLGKEADWNIYIQPNAHFPAIEDLRSFTDPDELPCPNGQGECLVAEVTPHSSYYLNPYFPKTTGQKTPLLDKDICVYGPWVWEEVHGNHPEIHPLQLIWWKDRINPNPIWMLMQIQDASDRFIDASNFSGPNKRPNWRPWAVSPQTAEFRLAFKAELNQVSPQKYALFEIEGRDVVSDQDPKTSITLAYDGKPMVEVLKKTGTPKNLGIRFDAICRNVQGSQLNGYIVISSTVGDVKTNDGGAYHIVQVIKDSDAGPIELYRQPQDVVLLGNAIGRSLKGVRDETGQTLVGDVKITALARREVDLKLETADFLGGHAEFVTENAQKRLKFTPEVGAAKSVPGVMMQGTAYEIPILGKNSRSAIRQIHFTSESGLEFRIDIPTISVVPYIGAIQRSGPRQWRVEIVPRFATYRNGKPYLEDDNDFVEHLNFALVRNNREELINLFGSAEPFTLTWDFQARNLTKSSTLRAAEGSKASPTDVRLDFVPGTIKNNVVLITFPEPPVGESYEVSITATMTDTFGSVGTANRRLTYRAE